MSFDKKAYNKKWYLDNLEEINKKKKEYYNLHRNQARKAANDYYQNHKERVKEKHRINYFTPQYRFYAFKASAKTRKIISELSFDNFVEITSKLCKYCGDVNKGLGIDRVDSSIGYLKENCVSCCKNCNYMKLDHSLDDFLSHIEKIYNFNKKTK